MAFTTYQLFDRAEKIELLSARAYGALARAFGGDPDVRALFARLEAEEQQHASRIRLLAAHYRNDPKLRVDVPAAELERCLEDAGTAVAEIEAGLWPTDLAEVKRRLRDHEERLGRAHADLLATTANPSLHAFFAALAEQDAAHARLLAP